MSKNKAYWRGLIVRVIEDTILFMMVCLSIALVCYVCGSLLTLMEVN